MTTVLKHIQSLGDPLLRCSEKHIDLALTIFLLVALSVMIFPVPGFLLDFLLATNLLASVTIFVLSLYTPGVHGFSTFPSLLLFTTLFRLALNVSTTRSILTTGEAGQIIDTFGNFVVAGNLIVGFVIFIIILIVQLMVIGKGAERVAEVAARFTLDAMPGKQTSIDAQVKNGSLTQEQGNELRARLSIENQVYGAMDGAMKFVKGDAMAGLVITAINLIAGMAVGSLMFEMSFAEAAQRFSILTIGDGLVSQIPALLIALTAGIVVTRVDSGKGDLLGKELAGQYFSTPPAMLYSGIAGLALSAVPGFPTIPFLLLSTGSITLGVIAVKRPNWLPGVGSNEPNDRTEDTKTDGQGVAIELAEDLASSIDREKLKIETRNVVRRLCDEFGFPIPEPKIYTATGIGEGEAIILILGSPRDVAKVRRDCLWVQESAATLRSFKVEVAHDDSDGCWMTEEQIRHAGERAPDTLPVESFLAARLGNVVRMNAGNLLGLSETEHVMRDARSLHPAAVSEVERLLSPQLLREIFRRLLDEGVGLKYHRLWLETLGERAVRQKDPTELLIWVRHSLRHSICRSIADSNRMIHAYAVDVDAEAILRKSMREGSNGSIVFALPPEKSKALQTGVLQLAERNRSGKSIVLICSPDIRRPLWRLLSREIPTVKLVSFAEIDMPYLLSTIGTISFSGVRSSRDENQLRKAV